MKTQEELERCQADLVYFISKYIKQDLSNVEKVMIIVWQEGEVCQVIKGRKQDQIYFKK